MLTTADNAAAMSLLHTITQYLSISFTRLCMRIKERKRREGKKGTKSLVGKKKKSKSQKL